MCSFSAHGAWARYFTRNKVIGGFALKHLRRINWILAATTWVLAFLCGLANLMGWDSLWFKTGMPYGILIRVSLFYSLLVLILELIEPGKKKVRVLRSALVIAISVLVAIPFFVWFQKSGVVAKFFESL